MKKIKLTVLAVTTSILSACGSTQPVPHEVPTQSLQGRQAELNAPSGVSMQIVTNTGLLQHSSVVSNGLSYTQDGLSVILHHVASDITPEEFRHFRQVSNTMVENNLGTDISDMLNFFEAPFDAHVLLDSPNQTDINTLLNDSGMTREDFFNASRELSILGSLLYATVYDENGYAIMSNDRESSQKDLQSQFLPTQPIRATEGIIAISVSTPSTFQTQRNIYSGYPYDPETDGCSFPFAPARFRPACVIHDFGYRNGVRSMSLHNVGFKVVVDANMSRNMFNTCSRFDWLCRGASIMAFGVVQVALPVWTTRRTSYTFL